MTDKPEINIDLTELETSVAKWGTDDRVATAKLAREQKDDAKVKVEESARFNDLINELAKSRQPVSVLSISGQRYIGVVIAADESLVCIETQSSRIWLRSNAISRLQSISVALPTIGSPNDSEAKLGIATVLAELGFERTPVRVYILGDSQALSGTIERCAEDFVTLRLNTANEPLASVRIGAITEVLVGN